MNRKWMSFLLAAALALTTVFGTGSVTLAEETTETAGMITVYVAAEGTDTEGHTVNVGITPVRVEAGTTADKAVAAALESSGYDKTQYTIEDSVYGANLTKIGDVANASDWSYWWVLYVNGAFSNLSLGNVILQDNDKISYVYMDSSVYVATGGAVVYTDDTSLNPDSEASAALLASAKEQQQVLAKNIYDSTFGDGQTVYGLENVDAFYVAFSLMRAGYFPEANCYGAMYQKLASQLKDLQESGSITVDGAQKTEADILGEYPELTYAKAVLFVSALGGDAKNVGGVDLIEKMAQKSVYEASAGSYTNDCTILLAWDSADYELPTGDNYITRAQVIDSITGQMDSTMTSSAMYNSPDMIAMLLQPLYRYTQGKADLGFDDVALKQTCIQGIQYLEDTQSASGSWDNAYGSNNAWTLAQIMTTIGQFEINACSEEDGSDFIKNGKTVLDDAAAFVDTENGTVDEALMALQPEQLLRGLNAVIRVMDGQNTLYDTTDAQNNVPDLTPTQTPAAPTQTPAATPAQTPATPTQTPAVTPSQTPTASAIAESQEESGAVASSVKKVKAVKTKMTVKKGKKTTLKWNVTLKKKNAALGKTTVKVSPAVVKVTKKKVLKKSAKVRMVTVQVKGIKKGTGKVTLRVGGKSAAVKVRVK